MKKLPLFILIVLVLGSVFVSCTDEQGKHKIQEQRNPDGTLRMLISLAGNKLDGRSLAYYSNGKIESDSRWRDGKRSGVTRLFYRGGNLRDSSVYANDSLNGLSLVYYQNGILKQRAHFIDGTETGVTMLFDSVGRPVERHVFSQKGQLIYANSYDKIGKPSGRGMHSIIEVPDTISWGEPYSGCIHFGYPITGNVKMLIGSLITHVNAFDRFQIKDTLLVVNPDDKGRFCFSYLPKHAKLGKNYFQYKFLQSNNLVDSLSVDNISGSVPFVINSKY